MEARRNYVHGPLFSQILGYTGPITRTPRGAQEAGYLPDDLIGNAGVELEYESHLRGDYGRQNVERDASGRQPQVLRTRAPIHPRGLGALTIDAKGPASCPADAPVGDEGGRPEARRDDRHEPQTGEILRW